MRDKAWVAGWVPPWGAHFWVNMFAKALCGSSWVFGCVVVGVGSWVAVVGGCTMGWDSRDMRKKSPADNKDDGRCRMAAVRAIKSVIAVISVLYIYSPLVP